MLLIYILLIAATTAVYIASLKAISMKKNYPLMPGYSSPTS